MSQQPGIGYKSHEGQTERRGIISTYAWVILGVVFLASLAASLNQAKVPPVLPVLMETFNLSLTNAGMLMSIFVFTGVILALPAGLIMHRLGLKVTALIAVGSLVVDSSLGALSTMSRLLLLSRFIEGVGMGLISVVAPAAITMWFVPQKRGTPMGNYGTTLISAEATTSGRLGTVV